MRFSIILICFLFSISLSAQELKVVKFDAVQQILDSEDDTLYILNFWATWCKPCVEEMPYFEEAHKKFIDEKVKIILISMDFEHLIESRVQPFLEKKDLKSEVWLLDETKYNDFIDKVDPGWSGAIPFTICVRGKDEFRYWKEGQFTEVELLEKIKNSL